MPDSRRLKLLHVVGTRPNFMKISAIIAAVDRWNATSTEDLAFEQTLVHTGQHYDEKMSRIFFEDLGLPQPNHYLGVGSGSHAEQTANAMRGLEAAILTERPDLVVTAGDVNSTLAAALVASKLGIPVAHVEAGLRSRDRSMPEELNRIVVDQLSDLLLTTSRDANDNLLSEGVSPDRIHFVGNTMIDTLYTHLEKALRSKVLEDLEVSPTGYGVVTLHRPSNVDDDESLGVLLRTVRGLAERIPVVFPVHARTRQRLAEFGLDSRLSENQGIHVCEPLGYLDFLCLIAQARIVLTDSGGIQEETTVLGVPCLTLRENTERPVTITNGTNRLCNPRDSQRAIVMADEMIFAPQPVGARKPELWDGHAGDRAVLVFAEYFAGQSASRTSLEME